METKERERDKVSELKTIENACTKEEVFINRRNLCRKSDIVSCTVDLAGRLLRSFIVCFLD